MWSYDIRLDGVGGKSVERKKGRMDEERVCVVCMIDANITGEERRESKKVGSVYRRRHERQGREREGNVLVRRCRQAGEQASKQCALCFVSLLVAN